MSLAIASTEVSRLSLVEIRTVLVSLMADVVFLIDVNGRLLDVPTQKAADFFTGRFGETPWQEPDGTIRPIPIWEILYEPNSNEAMMFEMSFEQLADGMLPLELVVDQLPARLVRGQRQFRIQYRPLQRGEELDGVALCLDDRTPYLEEDRESSINAEFRKVMTQLMTDLEASRGFFSEMRWLVGQLQAGTETVDLKRVLHTMKGNLGIFGFDSLATFVHKVEDLVIADDMASAWEKIGVLRELWAEKERVYGSFFTSRKDVEITLSREEYEEHVMMLMMQSDYTELLGAAQRWAMDPISQIFSRLEIQLKRICGNLGKQVEIVSEHNMVRLPGSGLQPLWASLTHIVRNAADHAFQIPEAREAAGKPPSNAFTMSAEMTDEDLIMKFTDDGRGIAWDKIRAKAAALGLPSKTDEDLVNALFADEVSSNDSVNQLSGRGVGTGAVKAAVEALGGQITVTSTLGEGTTFTITIPLASLATLGVLS